MLRPSNAGRWSKCPGSYPLEALFPEDEESPAAREGTAAHFYATERLNGRVWPVGHLTPNGVPIDQDMIDGGELLHAEVTRFLATCGPRTKVLIETRVTMHGLVHPLNEGTPDVFVVDYEGHKIAGFDYKYGHRYVEEFQNPQLIDYFAGVFEGFELNLGDVKGWECLAVIVQPRYFGGDRVRTWRCLGRHMWAEIEKLATAALAAASPAAPTLTGPQCRDCLAVRACPAAIEAAAWAAEFAGGSSPVNQSPADAAAELAQLDLAKARLDARHEALSEVVTAAMRSGATVPYWELTRGQTRTKWVKPAAEVAQMGDLCGVNLRKPDALLTPTQAIEAGLPAEVVAGYSEKLNGEIKLKRLDPVAMAKRFAR